MRQPACSLRPCYVLAPALLAVVAVSAQPAPAPSEPTFGARADITAIELMVTVRDAKGAVPADLGPADLEVLEDGKPVTVVSVEPGMPAAAPATGGGSVQFAGAAEPRQIVVYLDAALSATRTLRTATEALAAQAVALTELGFVEIVIADPMTKSVLAPSRDPAAVRQALLDTGRKHHGREALLAVRRDFLRGIRTEDLDVRPLEGRIGARTGGMGSPGMPASVSVRDPEADTSRSTGARRNRQRLLVRSSAQQEALLLSRQRAAFNDWLAAVGRTGPRALVLVSDGFDSDPRGFYLTNYVDENLAAELESDLAPLDAGALTAELGQLASAAGWTVVALAPGGIQTAATSNASDSGSDRFRAFAEDQRAQKRGASNFLMINPLAPLLDWAAATGGELITDASRVDRGLAMLRDQVRLTYQVERPPDGRVRKLEVRSRRPGLTVRAPGFAAAATPDTIIAARARRLLVEAEREGELGVALAVTPTPSGDPAVLTANVRARVDLAPLGALRASLSAAAVRVTVALALPDGRVSISQQTVRGVDLAKLVDWQYAAPLRTPVGTEKIALVVDELSTGVWGGAAATIGVVKQ